MKMCTCVPSFCLDGYLQDFFKDTQQLQQQEKKEKSNISTRKMYVS